MNGEAAEQLDATLAAADRGEAPPAAPAGDPAPAEPAQLTPPPESGAQLWIDAAEKFGGMARVAFPEKLAHWSPELLRQFGVELAGCAAHFGWTFGGVLTHPVAKLIGAGLPLAWPFIEPHLAPYMAKLSGGAAPIPAAPIPAAPIPAAPIPAAPIPAAEPLDRPSGAKVQPIG